MGGRIQGWEILVQNAEIIDKIASDSIEKNPTGQIGLEGHFRYVVSPRKKRQKDTQIELLSVLPNRLTNKVANKRPVNQIRLTTPIEMDLSPKHLKGRQDFNLNESSIGSSNTKLKNIETADARPRPSRRSPQC